MVRAYDARAASRSGARSRVGAKYAMPVSGQSSHSMRLVRWLLAASYNAATLNTVNTSLHRCAARRSTSREDHTRQGSVPLVPYIRCKG
eukprot:2951589-Prymnesium_polylepis.2